MTKSTLYTLYQYCSIPQESSDGAGGIQLHNSEGQVISSVKYLNHHLPQTIVRSTPMCTFMFHQVPCLYAQRKYHVIVQYLLYTDKTLEHSETVVSLEKALVKEDEHMEIETKDDHKRSVQQETFPLDHHHPSSPGSSATPDKHSVEVEVG